MCPFDKGKSAIFVALRFVMALVLLTRKRLGQVVVGLIARCRFRLFAVNLGVMLRRSRQNGVEFLGQMKWSRAAQVEQHQQAQSRPKWARQQLHLRKQSLTYTLQPFIFALLWTANEFLFAILSGHRSQSDGR